MLTPSTTHIVGLGIVVIDHLVILPEHPPADTKTNVLEDRFQVGGPVPTALVLLRRFGWQCSLIGHWADDAFGEMIEADLHREGVGFDRERCRCTSRSGFSHVWIDRRNGTRTIACSRPRETLGPEDLDEQALRRADALHLDGWPSDTALAAARIVRRHGGQVFLDTGNFKPGMEELIRHADVVNCPRRFLTQFLETEDVHAGIAALLRLGPRVVTVTSGDAGAAIGTSAGVHDQPAFAVQAVDTSGAGDVFCGGMIHGVLNNWPPERILRFAAATAALKCSAYGNRDALPSIAAVTQFLTEAETHREREDSPRGR